MGHRTGLDQPAGDFWQPDPEDRSIRSRPLTRRFRTDLVKRSLIPAAFVLAVGSSVIVAPPTTAAHPAGSNGQSDSHTTTLSQSRLALSSSNTSTTNGTTNSNSGSSNSANSSNQSSSFSAGIQVTKYTTKQGQTLVGVAEATGRSVQTLLWANEIQDTDAVFDSGVTLVVPPVDGVLYTVRSGDSLASIAQYFQVSVDAITGFAGNQVSNTSNLSAGQLLMVPGATGLNRTKVITYTVGPGDSVRSIAGRFGLQTNTIFWANRNLLTNPDKIMPGDQLTILPTDGVYITVQPGQSIYGLAEIWGVAPSAITGYAPNGISMDSTILPGDNLIIPGVNLSWPPPQPKPVVTQTAGSTTATATTTMTSADTETGAGAGTANTAKAGSTTGDSTASTASASSTPDGSQTAQFAQESAPKPVPAPEQAPDTKQATTTTQTSPTQEPTQAPAETPTAPPPPPPTPTPAPPPPAPTPTPVPPQPTPTPQPAAQEQSSGLIWPLQGTVTQGFGPTSFGAEPAYDGYAHFHTGLDIAAPQGTPIHAAAAGTVTAAGWNNYGYGYMVEINHGNGLVTLYGHMMQQPSVSVGEQVSQGETIGYVGTTGNSTGDHCHFGVELNGTWVNPYNYLP